MLRYVFAALAACLAGTFIAIEPAQAQIVFQRNFPPEALRGEIAFGSTPPEIQLNEVKARLAPGARIFGQTNMMVMSDGLRGQTFVAHYTRDLLGQPKDVWLLRPEEIARTPWPRTTEESRAWKFNITTQLWTKP
jgi:hypothetical protein